MDAYFAGLTKRQAMMLLTAVTFGGAEGVEAFEFLPPDEADVLKDRARQILEIPREKRLPFLVSEIKRFITGHKLDVLRFADPKRVAEALAKERPAMVEVILRALPGSVAEQVRASLAQPVVELLHKVRPDVLAVIRWKFEEQLSKDLPLPAAFSISDLVTLPSKDLIYLADVLGAKSLAAILAALTEAEREEVLQKLSPEQRQSARAASPPRTHRLPPDKARDLIEKAFAETEPKTAVRLMGFRRVAKACLSQSAEFAARVIEQHRDDFGRQLAQYVSEERQRGAKPNTGVRDELLQELEELADRGVLDRPLRVQAPKKSPTPVAGKSQAPSSSRTPSVGPKRVSVPAVRSGVAPPLNRLPGPPSSSRPVAPVQKAPLVPVARGSQPGARSFEVGSQPFDLGSKSFDLAAHKKNFDSEDATGIRAKKKEPSGKSVILPGKGEPPARPIQKGGAAAEREAHKSREFPNVRRPSVIRPMSLRGPRKP